MSQPWLSLICSAESRSPLLLWGELTDFPTRFHKVLFWVVVVCFASVSDRSLSEKMWISWRGYHCETGQVIGQLQKHVSTQTKFHTLISELLLLSTPPHITFQTASLQSHLILSASMMDKVLWCRLSPFLLLISHNYVRAASVACFFGRIIDCGWGICVPQPTLTNLPWWVSDPWFLGCLCSAYAIHSLCSSKPFDTKAVALESHRNAKFNSHITSSVFLWLDLSAFLHCLYEVFISYWPVWNYYTSFVPENAWSFKW